MPSLKGYDTASRTDDRQQLSDEQWFLIEDLFPWTPPSRVGGRPLVPPRAVFEALLWLLCNGGR
ncbi:MAG: transposase [Planctomycetota bacterium]|nr:MAG: transposase [Planctomycetota bacterium]